MDRDIPSTVEIFNRDELTARHPNILTKARVSWALRNRHKNGLAAAVFESRAGELLIHEPAFLRWFLGLTGRAKPRAARGSMMRDIKLSNGHKREA